jgi:hypothetical protein
MALVMFYGEDGKQTRFIGVTAKQCDDALLSLLTQQLVDTGICTYDHRAKAMRVNRGKTSDFRLKETELMNVTADAGGRRAQILVALLRWVQGRQR